MSETSLMLDSIRTRARVSAPGGIASSVGAATSRVGPLVHLPQVLRELGFDPSAVLAEAGFDPSFFADPDMPITYAAGGRLLAHCAAVTGCEHLGLLVSSRAGADALGLPGLLLMSAKDVRSGLHDLARYMSLHDRGAVVRLDEDHGVALLSYSILGAMDGADLVNDISMLVARNLMRGFCGESWSPSEVLLPRRRPADDQPWRRCFRAPVRFDAERCALRFPAQCLALSPPAANPTLHQYLRREADRLHALLGKGLVVEVRRIVHSTIASPPCNVSRVAELLGLHERTLNRRLQADCTSFRRLRDEVLHDMSRQMLGNTSMRVADVAATLGYSEASAFIHAFTRWAGQTPDQWRRSSSRSGVLRP
jgi:AraC-like DNA-binding protein